VKPHCVQLGERQFGPRVIQIGSLDRLTASNARLYVDHVQKPEPCAWYVD